MRRTAHLFLVVSLLVVPGWADSLSSLPDPGYSDLGKDPLSGPIAGAIDRIVHPTLGFPSIVAHGDVVTILLTHKDGASMPSTVRLRRTLGPVHSEAVLPIRSAVHDPSWNGYRILAEVPASVPPDTYDLLVEGPGTSDRQPNAVRVLEHGWGVTVRRRHAHRGRARTDRGR